jgi:hypothetical protein
MKAPLGRGHHQTKNAGPKGIMPSLAAIEVLLPLLQLDEMVRVSRASNALTGQPPGDNGRLVV